MTIKCFATRTASSWLFFCIYAENKGKIYKITVAGKVMAMITDMMKKFLK
jgi:hypothetical protein